MKLYACIADPGVVEAALDDVEGRHLLGDEQDCFPVGYRGRDHVGDRLRFAGSRRSLDDEVSAATHVVDRERLRTVAVDDMEHVRGVNVAVDPLVLGQKRFTRFEAVRKERPDRRLVGDPSVGWPVFGIEVPVHQELGEREEAEDDVVGQDRPVGLRGDSVRNLAEVRVRIELVAALEGGQAEGVNAVEVGLQRQVRSLVLGTDPETKTFTSRAALELDRHEDERCVADVFLVVRIYPPQHAKRQEENVDALLLLQRPRVVVQVEKPLLEPLRGHPSLELGVEVTLGPSPLVDLVVRFVRLRELDRVKVLVLLRGVPAARSVRSPRGERERFRLLR